jgi:group I intron endonuclease
MNNIFYVYALYDPNEYFPFYIGKGCKKRIKETLNDSRNSKKKTKIDSIISSGNEVKSKIIYCRLTEMNALLIEEKLINEIGRIEDGGPLVNILTSSVPNAGFKHTKEAKKKISDASKNMSREAREKIRLKISGENHYNFGKKRTKETREKISKKIQGTTTKPCSLKKKEQISNSNKKYWKNISEEEFRKRSDPKKGTNNPMFGKIPKNAKVVIIDSIRYLSCHEAAKAVGVKSPVTISNRCNSLNFPNYRFEK